MRNARSSRNLRYKRLTLRKLRNSLFLPTRYTLSTGPPFRNKLVIKVLTLALERRNLLRKRGYFLSSFCRFQYPRCTPPFPHNVSYRTFTGPRAMLPCKNSSSVALVHVTAYLNCVSISDVAPFNATRNFGLVSIAALAAIYASCTTSHSRPSCTLMSKSHTDDTIRDTANEEEACGSTESDVNVYIVSDSETSPKRDHSNACRSRDTRILFREHMAYCRVQTSLYVTSEQ